MKVQITVAIITKNEEANIGRCLEAVKPIADEMLVVDSFSTDRTQEICLSHGARFIQNPFKGHIEQKNFALANARFDQVLSLDADEIPDQELIRSILAIKQNWKNDGYTMNRLNNYCGKWIRHTGWYPDTKLRLVDRRKAQWGGKNPHDVLLLQEGASAAHLSGDILHYSYTSISQHIAQMNFFTDIMARDAFERGKKVSLTKTFLSPGFKFFRKYFIQQGFRDGYYGLVISILTVFYTFMKYLKLRELHNELNRK